MKIEIVSDVFDIVKRIKKIDKDYYIIFDTLKHIIPPFYYTFWTISLPT